MAEKSKTIPFSLRVSPEFHERLSQCAERLKKKKHTLAQELLAAAMDAIDSNKSPYLVSPVEFDVKRVAVEVRKEKVERHDDDKSKRKAG